MAEIRDRGSVLATEDGIQILKEAKAAKENQNEKPWTYTDIEIKSGINARTIRRFFRREKRIDESKARKICQTLGVSFNDVVEARSSTNNSSKQKQKSNPKEISDVGFISPNNLYPLSVNIVGHEKELGNSQQNGRIYNELQNNQYHLITGMPGVGTSELALQYAHKHLDKYGGGIIWVEGEGNIANVVVKFVRGVFPKEKFPNFILPEGEDEIKLWYCLQNWPNAPEMVLVIIDDVDDFKVLSRVFWGLKQYFKFLLTSQKDMTLYCGSYTRIIPSPDIAIGILQNILNDSKNKYLLEENNILKLKKICETLGNLPLAVHLVGRCLQNNSYVTIEDILQEFQGQGLDAHFLETADLSTIASRGVKAAFDVSWNRMLNIKRFSVFISLFADRKISLSFISNVPKIDEVLESVPSKARELTATYFIQQQGRDSYQMHQLIRKYLRSKIEIIESRESLIKQAWETIIYASKKLPKVQGPSPEYSSIFDELKPHAKAIYEQFPDYLPNENTIDIAKTLKVLGFVYLYDEPSKACIFFNQALEIWENSEEIDNYIIAEIYMFLASVYRNKGNYILALETINKSLNLLKDICSSENQTYMTALTTKLTILCYQNPDFPPLEDLRELLNKKKKVLGEHHPDIPEMYNLLGLFNDNLQEQIACLEKAISICKRHYGEYYNGLGYCYNNLAQCYERDSKIPEAQQYYQMAIDSFEKDEEYNNVAKCQFNLGEMLYKEGSFQEAYANLSKAEKTMKAKKHPDWEICYNRLIEAEKAMSETL